MNSLIKDISVKHSLGKVLFLCFHIFWLQAGDFDYNIQVDKPQPYMKEGTLVTVTLKQTNHDIVLLFDFDLLKSADYTFQRVDIQEVDTYHAAEISYTYLVYPLKVGKIDVGFSLTQKATTDESVAYSFSGDRDNVKGLVTTNTHIDLSPLVLDVKPIPSGTALVGDFTLDYQVNIHDAEAFEPLPMQIRIKGKGYPPILETLYPQEGNFTQFTETPFVQSISTTQGTVNTVTYAMAFSAEKSFTLPPLVIKAFNPLTAKSYELLVPAQTFNVQASDSSKLLDKVDNPAPFKIDWSWLETFLSYLVVFVAGYLTALSLKWQKKTKQEAEPLKEKIQNASTHKQLLQILLSQDKKYFTGSIQKLENTLYADENTPLKHLKKEALESIQ